MKRLNQFANLKAAIERDAMGAAVRRPTDQRMTEFLRRFDNQSPSRMQQNLILLFDDVPSSVQTEDLHLGNIPKIGEHLEKDAQVRHFMRSTERTTKSEALRKSRDYIWRNLFYSWLHMKKGVFHEEHWYDFLYDSLFGDFDDGLDYLAKALHAIEDSFAPGHVKRRRDSGVIDDIHYWDAENKQPDAAHDWPGHEALDNPMTPQSRPFFEMARIAAGELIFVVIANLDQPQRTYERECGVVFVKHFIASFS